MLVETSSSVLSQQKKLTRAEKVAKKECFISVIVPSYNEEKNLEAFLTALNNELKNLTQNYEILLIDDGSQDKTLSIAKSFLAIAPLKIMSFSRNFGKEIAMSCGLEHAKGDVAIIMDADFQHPCSLLKSFLEHWALGYDMVYGVRDRQHEPFLRKFLTKTFYFLIKRLTQVNIIENAGDFRLIDKTVIQSLNSCQERSRFMKGLYAWVGFKSFGIPFETPERLHGESSMNFNRLFELAVTALTSFSDTPLRASSLLGLLVTCVSFIAVFLIILKTLVLGVDVPGYASLIVTVLFFGGIQLLSIGVLGEYIARIFKEVKARPNYLIKEQYGFREAKFYS